MSIERRMTPRCPVCRTDRFVAPSAPDAPREARPCTCRRCGLRFEAGREPLMPVPRPR